MISSAATLHQFSEYAEAGYLPELIPILPPNAPMSERSKVVPAQRGKIPGVYHPARGVWTGFPDWTSVTVTLDDIRKWDGWPNANIGLRAKFYPCVDVDIGEPPVIIEAVKQSCFQHLGLTPVRGRGGSGRILLPYRLKSGASPIPKVRITFTHPSTGDTVHAIEFLGNGQQYLIDGIHPSGQPYFWETGIDLVSIGAAKLPQIEYDSRQAVIDTLVDETLPAHGCTNIHVGARGPDTEAKSFAIGDPSLLAEDLTLLAEAVNCIPVAELDYETWITLSHAIKAGCGGDPGFYGDCYLTWSLKYPGSTEGYIEAKWNSIDSSRIGASYVFDCARKYGFSDTSGFEETTSQEAGSGLNRELPTVRLRPGEESRAAREAERALLATGVPAFRYANRLVEKTTAKMRGIRCEEIIVPTLEPMDVHSLLSLYSDNIKFERRGLDGRWIRASCPRKVAEQYLHRPEMWSFPTLTGLTTVPVLRPDGTILENRGYDPTTGIVYEPDGSVISPIPPNPAKADAALALSLITGELLVDFPFVSPNDRSVALSFILTSCARRCFGHAPMHCFSAPKPGSGKGKLVNIASMIADGRSAGATDFTPDTEELRKNLEASMMQGVSTFNIDNVDAPLGGRRLCTLLTEDSIKARVLGQSRVIEIPCANLFSANGNNLRLKGDMQRRAIMCYIDPKCEEPEKRLFDFDPVERAKAERGRYVAAVLTILRAYILAGYPVKVSPFGSFDDWSRLIRGVLIWLGEADPYATAEQIKADEQETNDLAAVLLAWEETIGTNVPVTARELIERAYPPSSANGIFQPAVDATPSQDRLRAALRSIAPEPRGSGIDVDKLGYWLRSVKRQIQGGLRIIEATVQRGNNRWQLDRLADTARRSETRNPVEELLS